MNNLRNYFDLDDITEMVLLLLAVANGIICTMYFLPICVQLSGISIPSWLGGLILCMASVYSTHELFQEREESVSDIAGFLVTLAAYVLMITVLNIVLMAVSFLFIFIMKWIGLFLLGVVKFMGSCIMSIFHGVGSFFMGIIHGVLDIFGGIIKLVLGVVGIRFLLWLTPPDDYDYWHRW